MIIYPDELQHLAMNDGTGGHPHIAGTPPVRPGGMLTKNSGQVANNPIYLLILPINYITMHNRCLNASQEISQKRSRIGNAWNPEKV
jgi:hypothetical protein